MDVPLNVVARIARAQHGLATTAQMRAEHVTKRQIESMVRRGALERIRPGVYAFAGAPRTWSQALLAAVFDGGESAVASHASAARLWGFVYVADGGLELTVKRQFQVHVAGARVHRSLRLDAPDITKCDGVPCTSFERTLCDITTQLSWSQLARNLDDGLRRRITTIRALEACVARIDSGPNRRLSIVHRLLAQRQVGFDPGGSNAEIELLATFERAGIPAPVQQFEVRTPKRTYYLDLAWPEYRVFAEWYGLPWHIGASAVAYDSARITALSAAGWRPLVFTVEASEREIVDQTRRLLADAATSVRALGA